MLFEVEYIGNPPRFFLSVAFFAAHIPTASGSHGYRGYGDDGKIYAVSRSRFASALARKTRVVRFGNCIYLRGSHLFDGG